MLEGLMANAKKGNSAYFTMMTARPQTVGYGATDSPAGLAAWILVHPGFAEWAYGNDAGQSPTKDDVLDNITLYWLTILLFVRAAWSRPRSSGDGDNDRRRAPRQKPRDLPPCSELPAVQYQLSSSSQFGLGALITIDDLDFHVRPTAGVSTSLRRSPSFQ